MTRLARQRSLLAIAGLWPVFPRFYKTSACGSKTLRSAVGERGKWSGWRRGAPSASQPERNAAAEPRTEARRHCGNSPMPARDERAICGVEGASSRGGQGRRAARGTQQTARWSGRIHDYAGIQMRPACLCIEEFPPYVFLCQAFARLQNFASRFRQVC